MEGQNLTVEQFTRMLNTNYGMKEWPKELIVDAETYANCCQAVINHADEKDLGGFETWFGFYRGVKIAIGNHNGIIFKNVELILKT